MSEQTDSEGTSMKRLAVLTVTALALFAACVAPRWVPYQRHPNGDPYTWDCTEITYSATGSTEFKQAVRDAATEVHGITGRTLREISADGEVQFSEDHANPGRFVLVWDANFYFGGEASADTNIGALGIVVARKNWAFILGETVTTDRPSITNGTATDYAPLDVAALHALTPC